MKIDNEIKSQINEWFNGKRNYKEGLSLLKEAGFMQRGLLKTLEKCETKDNIKHLTWHLFKISDHTDPKICDVKKTEEKPKVVKTGKNAKNITTPPANTPHPAPALPAATPPPPPPASDEENQEDIPPSGGNSHFVNHNEIEFTFESGSVEAILMAKIIERQKEYYNMRAKVHSEMVELGDSNEADIVEKRKAYLEQIENFTAIVDFLHNQKLAWKESGTMPEESILEWVPEPEADEDDDKKNDVNNIADVDLQKELSKVRSRLSKYLSKIEKAQGPKLEELKKKKAVDEALKADLINRINVITGK